MLSRENRAHYVALAVLAVLFGIVLEAAMDPLEQSGRAWIGLGVGLVAFGGVAGYWYSRRRKSMADPDERFRRIELRASRLSHGVLTAGIGALALGLMVPSFRAPVGAILWVLLIGSVAVHELSIEYYRRRM